MAGDAARSEERGASRERLLVLDLNAISKNWAMTADAERDIRSAAPEGWRIHTVKAQTSSDGDGPPRPSDEVMEAIRDAEVYYGFGIPQLLFAEAKRLKWVHSAAAGVVTSLHPEMKASSVLLSNSAGIHAIPIAEFVVASVLHFLRGFDYVKEQQARTEWNKQPFVRMESELREMDTVRALVVGAGGIGSAVGVRLSALGARVTGIRRRVELGAPAGFDRVITLARLDAELPKHDLIVLAAPLTESTSGLLTVERLDLLPKSAIIVNIARGAMIDHDALAERLADGRLRGAALDVFPREPLAPESPLWQLRNVIVSPHISPVSPGRYWPRQVELFLDNWGRYLRGQPLRNLVDKNAGY